MRNAEGTVLFDMAEIADLAVVNTFVEQRYISLHIDLEAERSKSTTSSCVRCQCDTLGDYCVPTSPLLSIFAFNIGTQSKFRLIESSGEK